jgi:hypothetical protein
MWKLKIKNEATGQTQERLYRWKWVAEWASFWFGFPNTKIARVSQVWVERS